MADRKPFVGGNWKMNTNRSSASDLCRGVADALLRVDTADIAVFPPFPYLLLVRSILRDRGSSIRLGAQDVYSRPDGAYTGEVSVEMLKDCGVEVVICGHSERRHVLGEKDDLVNQKLRAVLEGGLWGILCVGERLEEREAGHTDVVVQRQMKNGLTDIAGQHLARLIVAYEPVWAIGTGKNATPQDVVEVHTKIRGLLTGLFGAENAARVRIIYGGSVKPDNAGPLFAPPEVDGGLIGGASLVAGDFAAVVRATTRKH
ncbi:MAG: triose-phosphate isomerase [Phycisphaerae bacterium]|nr:triose-phosphate isomerase [Phycisphaerae bacterium]